MERLGKIYDIISKMDFFNQRAARELWSQKPEKIQNQDIFNRHQDLCEIKEFVDDVAELMELEEQGLLLKLPCKEGDTVYTVSSYMECCREECKWLEEECEECWYYQRVYFVKETNFQIQMIALFGKTAFLTKAEAEAKLKELENE